MLNIPERYKIHHVGTYLVFLALSSISILVFINSSISFIISDLLNIHKNVGNLVGTLGFVDEIVVIVSAPLWGLASDYIAERYVACAAFCFMAAGLIGSVCVHEGMSGWWGILLLSRCIFAVGAGAGTTMISALIPAFTTGRNEDPISVPLESPMLPETENEPDLNAAPARKSTGGKLAGLVGVFSGLGALFALSVFLPLPSKLGDPKVSGSGLRAAYWIVAGWAVGSGIVCLFGLPNFEKHEEPENEITLDDDGEEADLLLTDNGIRTKKVFKAIEKTSRLWVAAKLALSEKLIALAYIGGFVARACSIGVALFLPLFVNGMFVRNGMCSGGGDKEEMKQKCSQAYIMAAKLSGTAQFMALIGAPLFGHFSDSPKFARRNVPIMISAVVGIISFVCFGTAQPIRVVAAGTDKRVEAGFFAYVLAAGMGISQIGAIVCSMQLLGRGIAEADESRLNNVTAGTISTPISAMRGSISGVYALSGGVSILILTKIGGLLADSKYLGAPFWLLGGFNGILLISAFALTLRKKIARE